MLGDYAFLHSEVAREPGEPLTSQDAGNCAWAAAKLVETIREYLPAKGTSESGHSSWQTQETAAASACNLYRAIEGIRNPHKRPFGPGRGTSDSFDYWLDGLHTPWKALCHAIDRLAEFYGWQEASTGVRLPSMPDVRSGQKIPPIDSGWLDAVKTPAEIICEICLDGSDGETEAGIAIYDVAFAIEDDYALATELVKKWVDRKLIKAEPIGKCPKDGRRQLYRLSELLSDIEKFVSLTTREKTRYRQALTAKLRSPRSH